ncbi:MAG TPA: hypothetical protein VGL56_19780 [Fimbriimonadaceae bacterium]|jgi:hypothetical protein
MAHIGRILWRSLELANDSSESGELVLDMSEVKIEERGITRRDDLRHERSMELYQKYENVAPGLLSENQELRNQLIAIATEVQNDRRPELDEVVRLWFVKSFLVNDKYEVTYSEHPETNSVGFGFSAGRIGHKDFAWDWFNVVAPDKASKLQESGSISFKMARTQCGLEILYMHFESDVSLRVHAIGQANPESILFRLNILEGSEIYWPSLIEGKLQSNGYLGI